MSLLPYLLERRRVLDAMDDNLLNLMSAHLMGGDIPWTASQEILAPPKNRFQVSLDVGHFGPDEISVKVADGFVVVEGHHDEKRDRHGWVTRRFTRRYPLPEGCPEQSVQSRLSSDGVLTIIANLDSPQQNERVVPITCTGPVKKEQE